MKVTYYVASSLDGYIAKEDGDVSWLEDLNISMEDAGYDKFYSTVDALVMGRKTYELVVSFGQWPSTNLFGCVQVIKYRQLKVVICKLGARQKKHPKQPMK